MIQSVTFSKPLLLAAASISLAQAVCPLLASDGNQYNMKPIYSEKGLGNGCVANNRCATCCTEAENKFISKGFKQNGMVMATRARDGKRCLARIVFPSEFNTLVWARYDEGNTLVCDITFVDPTNKVLIAEGKKVRV